MNETPFSIPFFSVVLLQVLFVLLTYSLYKTTSQSPLRAEPASAMESAAESWISSDFFSDLRTSSTRGGTE